GRTNPPEESDRVEKEPHLAAAIQEGIDFLVGHRLPPIGIVDYDLAVESAKSRLFARGFGRTNDVDDGRTAAANGHRFAVLYSFDQLRKLILGVCDADFHESHHSYYLWLCQERPHRRGREALFLVVCVTGIAAFCRLARGANLFLA